MSTYNLHKSINHKKSIKYDNNYLVILLFIESKG